VNYLAIDATTEACSVALKFNNKVYSRYEICPQSHSLRLLPMVDEVLKEANCKLSQLSGLIFGQGPGSFTGVRIGIGVAQGLAYSANLKLVGVSSMQAMAQLAFINHQQTQVITAIDARMSEVYNGYFELDENNLMQPKINEAVTPPSKVKERLVGVVNQAYGVGSGWDAYSDDLSGLKTNSNSPQILFPDAKAMLELGIAAFNKGESVLPENAQPVYVRDTVSWKKLPGK